MSGMTASLRALAGKGGGGFWVALGVVHVEDGEAKHWGVTDDGNVMVSVLLDDGATPVWALRGSLTQGIRRIPDVGSEVLVAHTQGEVEGIGVIVAVVGDDQLTDESVDKTLVIDGEVWVYDGTGTPVELALKSDVQAVVDAIKNSAVASLDGGATYKTNMTAALTVPTAVPVGTTVLKAK